MRKWIRPNPGKAGGTAPPSISIARARLVIQREARRAGRIRGSREDERLSYSQQALLAVPVSDNVQRLATRREPRELVSHAPANLVPTAHEPP